MEKRFYALQDSKGKAFHIVATQESENVFTDLRMVPNTPYKKKLPKTKAEFEKFYHEWAASGTCKSFIEYINECED